MQRKLCLLLALIFIGGVSTRAQALGDKIELSAGYNYLRFHSDPAANLNGVDISGQYKLSDWLGVAADVTGEYGRVGGVSSRVYTYLFGPQVTWSRWSRFSPFAHLLGGGAHFDGGGFASKSFAYDVGAGVDTKISPRLSWRILQVDALPTHLGSLDQHNLRLSTGIVVRF